MKKLTERLQELFNRREDGGIEQVDGVLPVDDSPVNEDDEIVNRLIFLADDPSCSLVLVLTNGADSVEWLFSKLMADARRSGFSCKMLHDRLKVGGTTFTFVNIGSVLYDGLRIELFHKVVLDSELDRLYNKLERLYRSEQAEVGRKYLGF